MEKKECKWCKEEIFDGAKVCYHCSRPQSSFKQFIENYHIHIGFFISVVMVILAFIAVSDARKEQLIASNIKADVLKVANIMVKISHVVADGSSRYDGTPKAHLDKLKEYEIELKDILDSNLYQQIEKDLKEINLKIKKQK